MCISEVELWQSITIQGYTRIISVYQVSIKFLAGNMPNSDVSHKNSADPVGFNEAGEAEKPVTRFNSGTW